MIRTNPLLQPERYGRAFADLVHSLKAMGREPDARATAESCKAWALMEVRFARVPSQHARDTLVRPLPPKHKGPGRRPYRPDVVRELFGLVRHLARDDTEAHAWVGDFLNLSERQIKRLVKAASRQ